MVLASSLFVSVECVTMCKLLPRDGGGRHDCSMLSCAWKAPRVLTGLLASTAHPAQLPSSLDVPMKPLIMHPGDY
uniref:Uncharacterized protein n=1 Tax=Rhizophora mucronata TaxID=61149 RepID=A0A2P2MT30_RHIMU